MRVNEKTRYPHPVLSVDTQDYIDSKFKIDFEVDEDPVQNKLVLLCKLTLLQSEIRQLIDDDNAVIGIDVRCRDTYYSRIHTIAGEASTVEFEPGILCGRVSLRPLIWTCKDIIAYSSPDLHPEYGEENFDIKSRTLLAWDEEYIVHVGRQKLAPMASIFQLARNDELEDGQISVGIESEKIKICAGRKTYEHIHTMRSNSMNQAVLLNGVYLPAVLQVLEYLRDGNDCDNCAWFQIFRAKCEFYRIDVQSADILSNAQKLLKMPYSKIEESFHE